MRVNKQTKVSLHREIEPKVNMRIQKISSNVLYRVIAFNNNRTQIIDCKDNLIEGSTFANRFKADHISSVAYLMTTHNRRQETKTDKPRKELFQNLLTSDFFGMRLIVISNWLFGVACLGSRLGDKAAQDLAARYYFS